MSASVRAGGSSEDSRGVRSLASTLFSSILAFALAAVLVLAVALAGIFYAVYEKEAEEQLVAQAHEAASALDATPASARSDILAEQFAGVIRYTLIAADGTVLFDSKADVQGMGSHADRPEVQTAEEAGEAFSARYSETAGTDTLYVAVKLGDGGVIRASEQRVSLAAFLGRMLLPVAAALCAVALLVFLLSRVLTRRIMKPVDALNFAEPLENEIYEEMRPLLVRIDRQQRQLKEQNEELALAESMRRDFSSNVSHEMKTPLQVISGYAELMMNGMVQPDDRQRFAGLIYSEAQAMRSLIDDVMMLSRLDESAFAETAAPVDLLATARRAQGRLASFAERYGVTVEVGGRLLRPCRIRPLPHLGRPRPSASSATRPWPRRWSTTSWRTASAITTTAASCGWTFRSKRAFARKTALAPWCACATPAPVFPQAWRTRSSSVFSVLTRAVRRRRAARGWVWPLSSMRSSITRARYPWKRPKAAALASFSRFPWLSGLVGGFVRHLAFRSR